ncbi:hypothetical protein QR680_009963 [Steinernema hermaphroditum]|uniref:Uncharacterized protein n=1 Tax=Steinernema hermaphroditum TaxID=289476 RepID=A0AA39IM96_9BILA|nr:hypothetical protein QR680_009963 [Steinernema hermaphroditum]
MSQHNTGNPEVQACLQQLEQVCTSVLALLQAFDKGSNSEVAQRLKGVDIAFCEIRQRTSAIDDLDNSEYDQVQQRADLERQITLKDELIGRIRNDWVSEAKKDYERTKTKYESSATARRAAGNHQEDVRNGEQHSSDSDGDDGRPIIEPQPRQ